MSFWETNFGILLKTNGLLNETVLFLWSKISRNIWSNQNIFDPIVYVPGFSRVRAHTFGGPQRTRIVDVLTRLLHTNVIWGVDYKEEIHGKDFFWQENCEHFFLTGRLWCWIFKNIISSQGGHWFFPIEKTTINHLFL